MALAFVAVQHGFFRAIDPRLAALAMTKSFN
jgi:hypothetical protein